MGNGEAPKPERGVGRPSKLTPELTERICTLLRRGLPRTRAARRAGIAVSTFMEWMNVNPEFSDAVHGAEDYWVEKAIGKVTDLVDSEDERVALQAAKFGLSYRFRDDFAKRTETTGADGGPVQHQVEAKVGPLFTDEQLASMSPEQLTAALAGLGQVPSRKEEG